LNYAKTITVGGQEVDITFEAHPFKDEFAFHIVAHV